MDGLLLAAILYVACAALVYARVERRWRWRWREIEAGRIPVVDESGGAYRAAGDVPRFRERAPAGIRVAAFSSLLLGQLFVPAAVVGALGIILGGLGLIMVPSLITAAKLYRAGISLLRRDPRLACFRARDAATWSLWASGTKLVLSSLLLPLLSGHSWAVLPFWLMLMALWVLELAQAMWLFSATRKWEDALFAASRNPTLSTPAMGVL